MVRPDALGHRTEFFVDLARRIEAGRAGLGHTRLVCIDGPAGSGKTTFADALARQLGSAIVHMDDLYEGWGGAFDSKLTSRIEAWLLTPWRHGLSGHHPVFDWAADRFTHWQSVNADDVVILEGVGAGNRHVRSHATEVVWIEAPDEVRRGRLLERDGQALEARLDEFMRRERDLFLVEDTRAASTLKVVGDRAAGPFATDYLRFT
jgi:cytidylate kinase